MIQDVVFVVHRSRIGIGFARQTVQPVIAVVDRVSVSVGLAKKVSGFVVGIRLGPTARKSGRGYATLRVIGKRGSVPGGIRDADQIVLGVVRVCGGVGIRIGG